MPVLALTEILVVGGQVAAIGAAVFAVSVLIYGVKAARRAL